MMDSAAAPEPTLRVAIAKCCKAGEAYRSQDGDTLDKISAEIKQALAAGDAAMWESLYGCVVTGVPGVEHLIDLYVSAAAHPLIRKRIPDLCRLARQGNKQSLAVVAAMLADDESVCKEIGADELEAVLLAAAEKAADLAAAQTAVANQPDEIERALRTYANLPAMIDVRLDSEGLTLETDDFPLLIKESSGLDLQKYFHDAFADAEDLTAAQKEKFAEDLFGICDTVNAFSSSANDVTMHRTKVAVVPVPDALSHGWMKSMIVGTDVSFTLETKPPYAVTFANVSGIAFQVGGKMLSLGRLDLVARRGKCVITPTLTRTAHVPCVGGIMDSLKTAGKDFIVGALMKLGRISTDLPVVMQEFEQYLADLMRFETLLHDRQKDLVAFFERTADITVDDPIIRSLLKGGKRLIKNDDVIEIERSQDNRCDLGGVALDFAAQVKLKLAKIVQEMRISDVCGVGIEIPFDSPAELRAIGLDLKRSLPNRIISFSLSGADAAARRRLVAGTAPGCWVGVDLGANMHPSLDAQGNWLVFGATNNPLSGAPQKFFLRMDEANNLNMTTQEIGDLLTQTAIEGFDPADPSTWKWGAMAIGGQTLLKAGSVTGKQARNLGRLIGWLLDPIADESQRQDNSQ